MRKRRLRKDRVALTALVVIAFVALIVRCGCTHADNEQSSATRYSVVAYTPLPADNGEPHINPESDNVVRFATRVPPGRLREIFCDTNDLQLTAARALGFAPIEDLRGAYNLKRPIVAVYSCPHYVVDSLWMSMPYLIPEAAQLLADISRAWCDTVKARSGCDYRLRVTSLTRSDYSVARLVRRNRAATEQSCHRYGTTFDVSWSRFDCRDTMRVANLEDMKNTLAEIIYSMREQGRCYAIYEHKSGCFHVTVRPHGASPGKQ